MSGSTRERGAAVIGLRAFHSVLSSLLYWFLWVPVLPRVRQRPASKFVEHCHGRAKDFSGEFLVFHGGLVTTDDTDGTDLNP